MNNNLNIPDGGINTTMCGFYKVCVLDSNKNVVADYGWNKNLILNNGMDQTTVQYFANLNRYGIAGSGSRPNSITSSASTITQSGNLIYLIPGVGQLQDFSSSFTSSTNEVYYSSSLQVGDVVKYANVSQSTVLAVDDTTGISASVNTSYTIDVGDAQTFTIWKTSQSGMHKEGKRGGSGISEGGQSSTYLTGVGNCGTTDTTGSVCSRIYRRTYDFVSESINRTYTEVGVSWATARSAVFSRALLLEPVIISASFRLRLVHDLLVTFTPSVQRPITASITGWPVAPATNTHASESLQAFLASTLNTSGDGGGITACWDPAGITDSGGGPTVILFSAFASPATAALSTAGITTVADRSTNSAYTLTTPTPPAHVTGSYVKYKSGTLLVNDINRTDIKSIGFGRLSSGNSWFPAQGDHIAACVLFHQTQSKANTQTLSFTWKWEWDRVLA